MAHLNVEIKARCGNPEAVRDYLRAHGADFRGEDRQVDTYFEVPKGRLKLREGAIENNLIYYERSDEPGPKASRVALSPVEPGSPLKDVLSDALEVSVVVDKRREIYFIDNVKFHLDVIEGLGTFMEIEAIGLEAHISKEQLLAQCRHYLDELEIGDGQLISLSYSDLLRRGLTA